MPGNNINDLEGPVAPTNINDEELVNSMGVVEENTDRGDDGITTPIDEVPNTESESDDVTEPEATDISKSTKPNINIVFNINSKKIDKHSKHTVGDSVYLPSITYNDFLISYDKIGKNKKLLNDLPDDDRIAISVVVDNDVGIKDKDNNKIVSDKVYDDMMSDENAEWTHAPDTIKASKPSMQSGKITGDNAKLTVSNKLGLGTILAVKLNHSGFSVHLRPIGERSIIELYRKIGVMQSTLGRKTSGHVYGDESVIYEDILLDFAISNVVGTSLDVSVKKLNLREMIESRDLNILFLAIINLMTPKGLPVTQACSNTLETNKDGTALMCSSIVEGVIDVGKIVYVDNNKLSASAIEHMKSNKSRSHTLESVKEYRSNISNKNTLINLEYNDTDIKVYLKHSSADEKIKSGLSWVNNITKTVDDLLGSDDAEAVREMVEDRYDTTIMQTYSQYIDKIDVGGSIIVDRDTINDVLETMIVAGDIFDSIMNGVKLFLSSNSLVLIGTPTYTCSACNKEASIEDDKEHEELLPINIIRYFFEVCILTKGKIVNRRIR